MWLEKKSVWNNFSFQMESSIKSVSHCEIRRQQKQQLCVIYDSSLHHHHLVFFALFFSCYSPNKRRHRLMIWELNWNSELIFRHKAFHKEMKKKLFIIWKFCYEMYTHIFTLRGTLSHSQESREQWKRDIIIMAAASICVCVSNHHLP